MKLDEPVAKYLPVRVKLPTDGDKEMTLRDRMVSFVGLQGGSGTMQTMKPTSNELRAAVLYLGGKNDNTQAISQLTIDRLDFLGVLHKRTDGNIRLTDYGKKVFGRMMAGGTGLELN
jgi:hypothetical protein